MKVIFFIATAALMLHVSSASAKRKKKKKQKKQEKVIGGIYQLKFKVAQSLRTKSKTYKITNEQVKTESIEISFSQAIQDSIKLISESLLSEKFNEKIACVYQNSKKGLKQATIGLEGVLGGMPIHSFAAEKKQNKLKHYVYIAANFHQKREGSEIAGKKTSYLIPKLKLVVKVKNRKGKVVFKKKIVKKKTEKLKIKRKVKGNKITVISETMTPENFVKIYRNALHELLFEE